MPLNPRTTLSPEQRALMSELGKLGNKARNRKLSAKRRKEIARIAVQAREALRAERRAKQQTK